MCMCGCVCVCVCATCLASSAFLASSCFASNSSTDAWFASGSMGLNLNIGYSTPKLSTGLSIIIFPVGMTVRGAHSFKQSRMAFILYVLLCQMATDTEGTAKARRLWFCFAAM